MNRKNFWSLLISGTMVSVVIWAYSYSNYERGLTYNILELVLVLLALISIIRIVVLLFGVVRTKKYKEAKSYSPILILVLGFLLVFSPGFLGKEKEPVPVKFLICYEGTQNTSGGLFRVDNTFEIHATGVFGYSKWHHGTWRINEDTLFINYNSERHRLLSDTNIIAEDKLIMPIKIDSFIPTRARFYLGPCKGLN